jgi:hypothetical protein
MAEPVRRSREPKRSCSGYGQAGNRFRLIEREPVPTVEDGLDTVRRGELDRLAIPHKPLDVLAQQIVAEVAARDWDEAALYERLRRAWPYRELKREEFLRSSRWRLVTSSASCWRGNRYNGRDVTGGTGRHTCLARGV